jgi:AcrR family transcriptional regulator
MPRSDARRNRLLLLDAARDLIALTGSDDISARDIAERAGVSSATLYRHFESKQQLVDEISVDRWHRMSVWAQGSRGPAHPIVDITAVLDRFSRMLSADAGFIEATGLQVGRTPRAIEPCRQLFDMRFAQLWEQARAAGAVREWSDPRDVVELVGSIRNPQRRESMLATVVSGFVSPRIDVERLLRAARRP